MFRLCSSHSQFQIVLFPTFGLQGQNLQPQRTNYHVSLNSYNNYFAGSHSIVITASSLPLPLQTGQSIFTRSRCSSPQKKPLPWQWLHRWPLLEILSFLFPSPINMGGDINIIWLFLLISIRFKCYLPNILPHPRPKS